MMKCSINDCPGEYEDKKVVHTVRHHGRVVVIDGVPAEVCSVCGDVLLKPDTVRRIEAILREAGKPDRTAPVYEYAS
jgi:YgiT-type zinc finger domain-containing protein